MNPLIFTQTAAVSPVPRMRIRLLTVFSILSLCGGVVGLRAESVTSDWFYRAWQTEDGLPDNTISGIAQSADGYLWVGTKGGVMRFNGTHFKPLPLRNIPDLPSRAVRVMFLDRAGNAWIGLQRGPLIRIGGDSYDAFDEDDGIPAGRPISLTDDAGGRVWVSYHDGVCSITDKKVTWFRQEITRGQDIRLACDAAGQVWLGNKGKLGRFADDGFELVHTFPDATINVAGAKGSGLWITAGSTLFKTGEESQLHIWATLPENAEVNVIFEDRSGAVWIGTRKEGLLRVLKDTVESVATSHVWVDCVTEDREGNIWAGTLGGGLNLIRPRAIEFPDQTAGLPFGSVQSVTCDRAGRLWAVGQNGLFASRTSGGWTLHPLPISVNCVVADAQGQVWVGSRGQDVFRINGEEQERFEIPGHSKTYVRSLFAAKNGDIWIATDQPDRLHRLRGGKTTGIAYRGEFAGIRAIAEGLDGTIWVGSSDGRLLRVERDRLIDEPAVDEVSALSIRSLHTTPDGSLWVGYAGDGLGHIKQGRYKRITSDNGLQDDYISQIQDDGEGSLWIAANTGLFKVGIGELLADSAHKLRCRVFGRSDGAPSFQPSRDYAPTATFSDNGHLYFSTHSGIIDVQPAKLRENTWPPPVVFEMVEVDQNTVAVYKTQSMLSPEQSTGQLDLSAPDPCLVLPPDHDKVVIHFAALSMTSPENVQLRYRLKPRDKNWVASENRNSITFQRLPSGNYEFQVIACNNAGVWNEAGAILNITVNPFIWETWWFRIGAALLTALIAGGLVFLALRRNHLREIQVLAAKRAVEQERSRIARDIHDDLGASLTRITLLSQSRPSTDAVLEQIHTTARHLMRSMEEVVWAVNPEHDTFDALANYLCNYGQSFLSLAGVRCRLEMPLSLPDLQLSAQIRHSIFLAFKEALNNAVKHSNATEVRISMDLGKDAFNLKIEDNGEGIDPSVASAEVRPAPGSGLINMKARMDEIGGTCVFHGPQGQGTTVEFKVPFKLRV